MTTDDHPIFRHLSPGMTVTYPIWLAGMTWGDLRELVNLGAHYPDDVKVEWLESPAAGIDEVVLRRPSDVNRG